MTAMVSPPIEARTPDTAPGVAAVSARGISLRFGNGRGVGPVDLEVGLGESLALMGRNGCGKTTLLRILATVARPQHGAVRWFGAGAAAARARVGLALDGALEDGGLTGRQATHFWCAQWVAGTAEVADRTAAMLERVGLAAAADEPVASYSYGMRRRLALAAALAHDPALGLLDEPTAGLDPEGFVQLAAIIRERSAHGRTTVVASNDPGFVESVAHRVAFLDEGEVVRCAAPADLLADLPPGRVAELVTSRPLDVAALRRVPGVVSVAAEGLTARITFEGDDLIAVIVAAADAPGGRLSELRLRRPDLADCFRELTGRLLEDRP
jgi:ABC-2 type transport system ATP-binding protein